MYKMFPCHGFHLFLTFNWIKGSDFSKSRKASVSYSIVSASVSMNTYCSVALVAQRSAKLMLFFLSLLPCVNEIRTRESVEGRWPIPGMTCLTVLVALFNPVRVLFSRTLPRRFLSPVCSSSVNVVPQIRVVLWIA